MIATDPYKEAMRYIDNANETLNRAGLDENYYIDEKYVKTACGTAYSGALKALDFLFALKGVQKRKGRKSIEYYQQNLSKIDKKLLDKLNTAYRVLHLDGYYDGEKNSKVIAAGFDSAISIIHFLKKYSEQKN